MLTIQNFSGVAVCPWQQASCLSSKR